MHALVAIGGIVVIAVGLWWSSRTPENSGKAPESEATRFGDPGGGGFG